MIIMGCCSISTFTLGLRGLPVLGKYHYIFYLKWYNVMILLISVLYTLLFRSSLLGGSVLHKLTRNVKRVK